MEEPNSAAPNENSVPISCHKRDGEFDDSDPVTKKSKIDGKEEQKKEISKEGIEKEMSFIIEADAAEDKGSRHSMEDKWVVLSDASLEFPGKLRFFIILSYFAYIFVCLFNNFCNHLL